MGACRRRECRQVLGSRDPPGVSQAHDAIVIGVQGFDGKLHLHPDLEIGGQGARDDLAQNDHAFVGQFHCGDGKRLERLRRRIRRGWWVSVFGIAPKLPAPGQRHVLQHVAVASRVGAIVRSGWEDVRAASRTTAADQMRRPGFVCGEPAVDRRFRLVNSFWHTARLPMTARKLKRVPVFGRLRRVLREGCVRGASARGVIATLRVEGVLMGTHLSLVSTRRRYWELIAEGYLPADAGDAVGVSATCARRWFSQRGGVNPQLREPKGQKRPRLTPHERDEIAFGAARSESEQSIARRLGRAASTVMREIDNNSGRNQPRGRYRALHRFGANRGGWDAQSRYRATLAQARSDERARRPKKGKLDNNPELREVVEELLKQKYSPEQIAGRLPILFPDRPEMRVSHETIYKHIYVQGRGELRRELASCLRTGRAKRKPRKRTSATPTQSRIPGMVNIAERPPEADDRAVPGHWEGDLIIGKDQASQLGTVVERTGG